MIKIKSLNKYFNRGRRNEIHVIDDISLELPEKGMVAVFGKSGCGKTTLLNVIGGLDGFQSGSVTVDGRDIRKDTDTIRNRYIGYIFQNYNLNMSESCYDNVADSLRLCGITDKGITDERVRAALAGVSMDKYASRTPDTLSGGQQQRIAIARAIVKDPEIILADEPTGNLDEANTVMIMDLLKAVSRDHLVLLVTHEENLVDCYCDEVIELKDGKTVSVRSNSETGGYRAKDKNDIYLGELEKREISDDNALIEYYGDKPETPLRIKIVNSRGKFYVRIDTEKVQVLDSSSEVKLKEGVFEHKNGVSEAGRKIYLPEIPKTVSGRKTGRLFSFASAVKSGYRLNFAKRRRGKRFFKAIMMMFAAIIVFTAAVNGRALRSAADVGRSYNHSTFYIKTPNMEVSEKLRKGAEDPGSGIDFINLIYNRFPGDVYISFDAGDFETFYNVYSNDFMSNAVVQDTGMCRDAELLSGRNDGLSDNEVLVSSAFADNLLESASLSYIKDYNDIVGLESSVFKADGKHIRIVGIVSGSESTVYLTELALAKYTNGSSDIKSRFVRPSEGRWPDLKNGEVLVICDKDSEYADLCVRGDRMNICGHEFTVADKLSTDYCPEENAESPAAGTSCSQMSGDEKINMLLAGYENELYDTETGEFYGCLFICTDEDYIKMSKYSDISAGIENLTDPSKAQVSSENSKLLNTMVHSSDTEKTEKWLNKAGVEYTGPDGVRKERMYDSIDSAVAGTVTVAAVLTVMSVCMYFIMKSSLMSRIKEVGVYRAIGVTKKNLIFKFFVESAVITTLSVLPGYIFTSLFIRVCFSLSPLMYRIFYYPYWLSFAVLAVLYIICMLFGTVPVILLLRKTPSEILSKYDI